MSHKSDKAIYGILLLLLPYSVMFHTVSTQWAEASDNSIDIVVVNRCRQSYPFILFFGGRRMDLQGRSRIRIT